MDECKPLPIGDPSKPAPGTAYYVNMPAELEHDAAAEAKDVNLGRGLHSSTSQLNLSASYGIGVRVGVV